VLALVVGAKSVNMIFTPAVIETDVFIAVLIALELVVAALPHASLCVRFCLLPWPPGCGEADLSDSVDHWDHNCPAGRKISPTHLVQAPQAQCAAAAVHRWPDRVPAQRQHVDNLPQSEPLGFVMLVLVQGMTHMKFDAFPVGHWRLHHPQQRGAHRSAEHEADV
jgi:hypothetical protein